MEAYNATTTKQKRVNSLHAEMVSTLLFINMEINVISLRSKWQGSPSKPWAVPVAGFCINST